VAELSKGFFRTLAGSGAGARFAALPRPVRWDLWTHQRDLRSPGPPLRRAVALPRTAFAGLGALGSAAALALGQLASTAGRLELVDDDRVDASNLERLLTAFANDVGRRKIDVARRALAPHRAARIAGRYGAELPRGARAGTILVGVDSAAARRAIARHLPYAVYHGGTQAAELLVTRHVGFERACLECLYPEQPGDRAPRPCGRAEVEQAPAATIGFVSAFCGFLMAAELVKDHLAARREHPLDTARPAFRLDLLAAAPGPDCVEAYVPRRDCFCQGEAVRRRIEARRAGRVA
jgi:molybdopterin/thiamine biosynthesis adenylyltransferase